MKQIVFASFFAGLLCLTACDPADQYPISFKANGTTWYAASAPAFVTSGVLSINALSTLQSQNKLTCQFTQYAALDTFDLDSTHNMFVYFPSNGLPADGYWSRPHNPAKFIVKDFNPSDKHIVAEFYGWLYLLSNTDSVLITDGKMDLHYQ